MALNSEERNIILDKVYAWSSNRAFRGYNKHDGLNSPLLKLCCGWSKWSRIGAIQAVMRSPVNIRPLLLVPKTMNPKGIALFLLGLLDRYKKNRDSGYLKKAVDLGELLLSIRSQGKWSGSCWGYPYPWQDLGFFSPPGTPNAVVTSFVCEALLELYRATGDAKYKGEVGGAIEFFIKDLTVLENSSDMMCLAYMPLKMSMRVMDVSILVGAVMAQYAQIANDPEKMAVARKLVNYVVDKQTDYHAWYYTDPPEDSFIHHDNYHTGFILDALWRYMEASGDWQWKGNYEQGLDFYARRLFNSQGAPNWMSDKEFPHDVHGSAQGLVTFGLAVKNNYGYPELLDRIGRWSVENLYLEEGRFMYRQNRYFTSRYTLLRWCNAWMFRGIAAWESSVETEV